MQDYNEGPVVFVELASWTPSDKGCILCFFLSAVAELHFGSAGGAVRAVAAQLIMTRPGLRTLHVGTATLVSLFSRCLLLSLLTLAIFPSRHKVLRVS